MDYLRQTIDSDKLGDVLNLPLSLRNKRVEVIILPAEDTPAGQPQAGTAFGCLKQYANPALIAQEKGAWERAAVEQHEDR